MAGMYAISEMAGIFGVSRQTLIYYDRIGLFHPAVVNEKGYRLYSPTQIPLLRLICMLRDFGIELDEVARLVRAHDAGVIASHLEGHLSKLDERVDALRREREGVPVIRHFPRRAIVFEPFPEGVAVDRSVLHPTLMRAISRLHDQGGGRPMRGWGAMLLAERFHADDPIAGAGSFALVPESAHDAAIDGLVTVPEGEYLCISRWGMPYDPTGIRQAVACLDEHRLRPLGNAFDFCFLDTTSYDEAHQEDFCCIQIPVAL